MTSARGRILQWTATVSLSLFLVGGVLAQAPQTPTAGKTSAETAQPGAKRQKGKKQNGQNGRRQSPLLQAVSSLTLTAEQKAKITPLTDKYREETRGASVTPQVRREKTKKLQEDINAVLTPEQKTKLRLAMARVNGPLVAAMRGLELTPEQRTKVTPIVQKASEDIARLNDDTSLKGKKKREKVQSIVTTAVTSIKTTGGLTDEQKAKLDTAAAKIGQRKNAQDNGKKKEAAGATVGAAK